MRNKSIRHINEQMVGRAEITTGTHPEAGFVLPDSHTVDSDVGGVFLRDPLALRVEDSDESGVLVGRQFLAEPRDLGPPPLLWEILELDHLELGRGE